MLHSMTGYGAATDLAEGVEYAVEVRSVNNRYFKSVIRLPDGFNAIEQTVERLVRGRINRGTVTLSVRMKLPDDLAAYRVNHVALRSYVDQLRELEVEANPTLRIDLAGLLQLPKVCEPPPIEDLCEKTQKVLLDLIERAIDSLLEMRRTEGKALTEDLRGNLTVIEENLSTVIAAAPRVVVDYHQRLSDRVQELLNVGNVKIDEENLAREVAIFAERCDIAEEISRLRGHLEQFDEAIGADGPAGRKLDFIAQEMLREANTIGSKANDGEITRAVVEIKTAIDRLKEQVQNAE